MEIDMGEERDEYEDLPASVPHYAETPAALWTGIRNAIVGTVVLLAIAALCYWWAT